MAGVKREKEREPTAGSGPPSDEGYPAGAALPEAGDRSPPDARPMPPPELSEVARRAARSSCTILITGETGVGKGFLAKWLHQESPRRNESFIPVNCGAIPETIIDSQLFGHVRGAFSGAHTDHPGLVRTAEKGTLFLDEVGELPPSAQTRLLRLLHDREVQPVGHTRPVLVDVRIMAATNGNLIESVRRRTFREDLLFRLDVVRIHVKPLRERRDEIDGLLEQFNLEFATLYRQPVLDFEPPAVDLLLSYRWPGNIRQLRTVVERLHVLYPHRPVTAVRLREVGRWEEPPTGTIGDFRTLETPRSGAAGMRGLENVRYEEVIRVLEDNDGSVTRTAAIFGVHRSTIYRWLRGRRRQAQGEISE